MKTITDEFMKNMLSTIKDYTLVLLKTGPVTDHPERQSIIWEHGRRNFALREEGLLSIVCPVSEENNIKGIYIFNADKEQTKEIMQQDPCVMAGIFVVEIIGIRSFPGDRLSQ